MNTLKKLIATCLLGASAVAAQAVIAYPHPVQVAQPDGTVVEVQLRGDEYFSWAETLDGYTLMHDTQGFWAFARKSASGALEASTLRYAGSSLLAQSYGIEKNLRFPEAQISRATSPMRHSIRKAGKKKADDHGGLQFPTTFPTTGKNRLLLLLVNFANTTTTYSQESFDNCMNMENYRNIGSFRDFYLQQSYGALEVNTTVVGWLTLPNPKSSYPFNKNNQAQMNNTLESLIRDALSLLPEGINLADFDNDKDGVLDGLAIIHQGEGQETSGSSADIWSMSYDMPDHTVQGIKIGSCTIQPETTNGKMSNIGVITHEFGHNLGAPDFYDIAQNQGSKTYPTTGKWDLMAEGSWNGNNADSPAGFNPWQKLMYGWITPVELTADCKVTDMPAAHASNVCYKIPTSEPGEYFMVENRQNRSFDAGLPGHGMLVYYVNEQAVREHLPSNEINSYFPQGLYIVNAAATKVPTEDVSSWDVVNTKNASFPGGLGKTELSPSTLPSTNTWNGFSTGVEITNITEGNELISFDFKASAHLAAPQNLTIDCNAGVTTLQWQVPESEEGLSHYCITRNNEIIANNVTELTFVDNEPAEGINAYSLYAVSTDNRKSKSLMDSVYYAPTRITNISLSENNGVDVVVNLNSNLYRSPIDTKGMLYTTTDTKRTSCLRFRASELTPYVGGNIKKISIYSAMRSANIANAMVHVWTVDANNELTLLSEDKLSMLSEGTWATKTLSTPVEIMPNQDYVIGYTIEAKNDNTVSIVEQPYEFHPELGNLKVEDNKLVVDNEMEKNLMMYAIVDNNSAPFYTEMPPLPETYTDSDIAFPLGFCVYRDNEFMGYTSGRLFHDTDVPAGDHTYNVTCIYADGTISPAAIADITTTAVESVKADDNVAVGTNDKAIVFGGDCDATIVSADGRIVFCGNAKAGQSVALQPGIYVVKIGTKVIKVAVR